MASTTNGDISTSKNNIDSSITSDPNYQKILSHECKPSVAAELVKIIQSGSFQYDDLRERTLDSLGSLSEDHGLEILKQFKAANLIGVQNKAVVLGTCVKIFRERLRQMGATGALSTPLLQGPDEKKLKDILKRTGYSVEVTIGQRKYGGPPPGKTDSDYPPSGSEVYIGRLPNDVYEDELIPLFEELGPLWDLRVMMNPLTSQNKGYAFATFMDKEHAKKAQEKYDGYEIKEGRKIKVNVSVANTRLFVGNIPKNHSRDEIMEEFSPMAEGLADVIVYTTPDDVQRKRNRGFAFLQYSDHKSASAAKNRLAGGGQFRPFGREVMVDWAEAMEEPDEDIMTNVKILYVKNLVSRVTEEDIRKAFEAYGEIERVKRQKDYAFVHFTERDDALKAMKEMEGHKFADVPCDICLAKPQMDKTRRQLLKRDRDFRQRMNFRGGYGGMSPGFRGQMSGGGRNGGRYPRYQEFPFDFGFPGNMGYDFYGPAAAAAYMNAAMYGGGGPQPQDFAGSPGPNGLWFPGGAADQIWATAPEEAFYGGGAAMNPYGPMSYAAAPMQHNNYRGGGGRGGRGGRGRGRSDYYGNGGGNMGQQHQVYNNYHGGPGGGDYKGNAMARGY